MAFIYWIRHKDHTDIFSEGYVGYTSKTVEQRWKGHQKEVKSSRCPSYPIYNAMKKYGDNIVVDTILEGSEDYCAEIEQKLRPSVKIGWNIHVGGNKGFKGDTHSEEARKKISLAGKGREFSEDHRRKISEANKQRVVTDETREKISKAHSGIPRSKDSVEKQRLFYKDNPWKNPKANSAVWLMALDLASIYFEDCSISAKGLAKKSCLKETQVTKILMKFRAGWNPSICESWLNFCKNYKEVEDGT